MTKKCINATFLESLIKEYKLYTFVGVLCWPGNTRNKGCFPVMAEITCSNAFNGNQSCATSSDGFGAKFLFKYCLQVALTITGNLT